MRVGIYCGSKTGNNPIYAEKAEELGAFSGKTPYWYRVWWSLIKD